MDSNRGLLKNLKVTVIGLGLIGGSLVKALYERVGIRDITAVNRSQSSIDQALKDGFISRGFTDLNEYIFDSDIIFVCTPVKPSLNFISELSGKIKPGCIVTDVCSTKTEIIDFVNKMDSPPLFIGGHPMAGTEKAGYKEGFSHLFENAYYILSKSSTTTDESLETMISLLKEIGAIPIILDADEHDKITAAISHTPHIIAASLVNLVHNQDPTGNIMQTLAAGGFKDITRIASSSPEIWENITLSNKTQIVEAISKYIKLLEKFTGYIKNNDSENILKFFDSARVYRNSFSQSAKGLISPSCDLIVDVMDKPGIIGEMATLLGKNGINIKNINVSNSREFEQGVLKVTLADFESVKIAFDLLSDKGYKVYMNA
jgi:prephenate dehydrogenase